MSRVGLAIIALFGLCVQVLGKPGPTLPLETGRESSSSGTISNNWYSNDYQQSVHQEPTKTVYNVQPVGVSQSAGIETGRDSYAEAASSLGYTTSDSGHGHGQQNQHGGHEVYPQFGGPIGPSSVFKYNLSPTNGHSYGGESSYASDSYDNGLSFRTDSEGSGGWLCRTFGGLCDDGQGVDQHAVGERDGTAPIGVGILGLVALIIKKIKLLPLLPLILPLLPILLPIALILLVPILALSFFLPIVPVVVISGRSMAVPWARAAQEAILGDDCIERISCEASRVARGYGYDAPWMKRFLETTSPNSKWIERISRGARSASECKKFTCKPINTFKKALKLKAD